MKLELCRDCGAQVPAAARGCPTCARNLDAERMLGKYFWLAALAVLSGLVAIVLYGRR